MKQILITGGAGYIGSAVALALQGVGYEVVVFDDLSTGQESVLPRNIPLLVGDVTDWEQLNRLTSGYEWAAVIHCAAKKAVGESEEKPDLYFHCNVTGSLNILRLINERRIPQLIFSSTAAVYDQNGLNGPVTETSPLNPPNIYGTTKLMVEQAILAEARIGRLPHFTIFRYFNVAGDAGLSYRDAVAQNVFPLLARAAATNQPFSIFGTDYETKDGTGVRDYIHLNDLVAAHLLALKQPISGIFNLGTGTGYSVRELIAEFNAKLPTPLRVVTAPRRPGDPAYLVADASLARERLGWIPRATLSDMVKSTVATYLN